MSQCLATVHRRTSFDRTPDACHDTSVTTNLDRYAGQARRVAAYERWLRSSTPGAMALRWLLGPGQWASNTAIYRLAVSLKLDHTTTLLEIGCERGSVLRTLDDQLHLDVPPVGFPARPAALFVGVLEKYKAVDVLADAWLRVVAQRPGAELHIVGAGRLEETVRSLVADPSLGVRWSERLDTAGVARALDAATLLVLPSRREGMGRVIVEAFCRGRPVVGTDSGGIPDLVEDGVNGLLVPTDDAAALAAALGRVMDDSALARRLGAGATASSTAWAATPEEFALRVRELVDAVLSRPGS